MTKRGQGSREIDIVTKSVGRICRRTGFDTVTQVTKLKAIIYKLDEDAQIDVLRAYQRQELSAHQLVDADRAGLGGAGMLAAIQLRGRLWESIATTLPKLAPTEETRRRYETSLTKLRRLQLKELDETAIVKDLERVKWKQLRTDGTFKSAADWNHLRRALGAFLTVLLGDVRHPFRKSVLQHIKLRKEKPRLPDMSVPLFWAIVRAAPEHARPCYVVRAGSGLRESEYLSLDETNLRADLCAIDITKSKTEEGEEYIFVSPKLWLWVEQGIPAPLAAGWQGIYWRRACLAVGAAEMVGSGTYRRVRVKRPNGSRYPAGERPVFTEREVMRYQGPKLHDLRHLFSQLADGAGATTEMVQAALRHTNPRQSSDYKRRKAKGEVAAMVGDALMEGLDGETVEAEPRQRAS